MAIVALAGIHQTFLLILPEALNLGCLLVLEPPVRTPASLNTRRHVVPVLVSHRLEGEQLEKRGSAVATTILAVTHSFRVLDKGFGNTHLPFFLSDAGVAKHALTAGAVVARPDVVSCVGSGG